MPTTEGSRDGKGRGNMTDDLHTEHYETPFGWGTIRLAGDLPLALELPDRALSPGAAGGSSRWRDLLEQYFAGEPVEFPLDVNGHCAALGCSRFETAVLAVLATVPYGRAVSYRDLAVAAGHPNACRAVGSVMARNELPVILPCHRVIRNDGALGRYGDDPAWKRTLLTMEGFFERDLNGGER